MATIVDAGIYSHGTIKLPRFGVSLTVAVANDTHHQWFPVRAAALAMGLADADAQAAKVSRDYPDAVREVPIKAHGVWRKPLCIRRREFALWIAGIDSKRCKPEIRADLEAFKSELMAEADRLLWRKTRHDEPTTSVRVEHRVHCPGCGIPLLVVHEDGVTTVVREDE